MALDRLVLHNGLSKTLNDWINWFNGCITPC